MSILFFLLVIYYLLMMANGIVIEKGSAVVLGFNILLFAYMFFLNTVRNPFILKFSIIYVYLLFILILILISSSEYYESLRMYAKYSISLMAFPAGFNLLRGKKAYKRLTIMALVFVGLFLINYVISTIFHLGGSNTRYGGETSIETGNLFDDALFVNVCVLALMPLLLTFMRKGRGLPILMMIVCTVVSIVCMKRMVIICAVLVLVAYLSLSFFINWRYGRLQKTDVLIRLSLAKRFFIICAMVAVAFLYWKTFDDQIEARHDDLLRGLEYEGRVREIEEIFTDIYGESIDVALLGKETFHTVGTYAGGRFGDRMIHTNFGIMLNGTGFFGLLFYLVVNLYFLTLLFNTYRRTQLKDSLEARRMFIAYIVLWITYNTASFSGTIWLTLYPTFSFLVMGGICRYFYDNRKQA